MQSRYFPGEEYEARWAGVLAEMKRRGQTAAVVWGRSAGTHDHCGDVLYLTNHYANSAGLDSPLYKARSFAAVILREGETPALHMDEPEPRLDVLATDRVEWHYDPIAGVAEALNRRDFRGRVALVGTNFLPVKYMRQLEQQCPQIEWVAEDDLVQVVRRLKSTREQECYRTAGEIVTRGLNRLLEGLVLGRVEAEAAADASAEVVRSGGRIHLVAANHGDTIGYICRNPLTGYSQDSPQPGDMVHGFLYGPMYQGYYLDPGRTAVAGGRPSAAQRTLVEACAGIVEQVMAAIRPGTRVMDAAVLGDRLTTEFGGDADALTEAFPFYGHGVGLFFELPRIGTQLCTEEDMFEADMVLGVEAFLARAGVGSAAIEQNFIIHANSNELLTTSPMYWW